MVDIAPLFLTQEPEGGESTLTEESKDLDIRIGIL